VHTTLFLSASTRTMRQQPGPHSLPARWATSVRKLCVRRYNSVPTGGNGRRSENKKEFLAWFRIEVSDMVFDLAGDMIVEDEF